MRVSAQFVHRCLALGVDQFDFLDDFTYYAVSSMLLHQLCRVELIILNLMEPKAEQN